GYKATPESNSFGQLIFHAADANYRLCALLSDDKAQDATVKADGPKQALIDQMKQSFAYCYRAFDKMAPLTTQVKFGTRDVTVAWIAAHTTLDWGDHYAQVAGALRLNGIIPPSAQRR